MSDPNSTPSISLSSVVSILGRYSRFILLFVAVSLIAIGIYGTIMPQTYSAEASVMPPEQRSGGSGLSAMLQSAIGGFGMSSQGPSSQVFGEILQTRAVAEFIADTLKLHQRPQFRTIPPRILAQIVQGMLQITVKRTGVISVVCNLQTGYMPGEEERKATAQLAADVANAAVAGLDNMNNEKSVSTARKTREYIERVQVGNKIKLDSLQLVLEEFQSQNKVLALDQQTQAVVGNAATLGAEVAKAEIELSLAQQEMQPGTPAIQQLQQRLAALRTQYQRAQSGGLSGTDRYSIPLKSLPKLGREYVNLTRDVTILEQVNMYLETQRLQEAIQEARDVPTVQVLDEAIPPLQKSAPGRFMMLLLTGIISPVIAILFVLAMILFKGFKKEKHMIVEPSKL